MTVALVLVVIAVFVGFRVALSEATKKLKSIYYGWKENLSLRTKLDPPPARPEVTPAKVRPERRRGALVPPNLDTLLEDDRASPHINSSERQVQEHYNPDNIVDILTLPATLRQNEEGGILARTFSHVAFILRRQPLHSYPDISASHVLKTPRVLEALAKSKEEAIHGKKLSAQDKADIEDSLSQKAFEYFEAMKSCISPVLLRISGWVMYKLLGRILSGVKINKKQIEMLRSAPKGVPLIYLPLHRSHLDYILLTFILYMSNLRVPLVAAGNNLHIPLFGTLLRGLGAFFIKRKLDPIKGRKDYIYRAVLHTYMEQALYKGHSLEFFIEGGRSRTGKSCLPKGGLLSVVVNSFLDGAIPDAYIVPVAISYEKLVDGNFTAEQMGHPKIMESFSSAVHAIWRTLHSNYGFVKVDFARPFSLKDFIQTAENHSSLASGLPNVHTAAPRLERPLPPRTSLYGTDIVIEDHRKLIKDLAEHVIYDAVQVTPLMSTNMTAFTLLTLHRTGASHEGLASSLAWIQQEVAKRRPCTATQDSHAMLRHSLPLLGPLVAPQSCHLQVGSSHSPRLVLLRPRVDMPHCLELQYYANPVAPLFVLDSILVRTYFALKPAKRRNIRAQKLVQEAYHLCNILQYEFLFTQPGGNIYAKLVSHLDGLLKDQVFLRYGMPYLEEEESSSASSTEDDLATALPFQIKENPEEAMKLKFLNDIIQPYIETYAIAAKTLPVLVGRGEVEESELVTSILDNIRKHLRFKDIDYNESAAVEPIKNALKLLENWEVLGSVSYQSRNLFYLQSTYEQESALRQVHHRILRFL